MDRAFDWDAFIEPVRLSLKVSLIASLLVMALGIWAAHRIGGRRFFGKTLLETTLMLPLVLPPTVVGFLLLAALGRRSWVGRMWEWWFEQPVIFTWHAAVIAAVVVAFPLVYQTLKAGFASVPVEYKDAARLDGAGEWQVLFRITIPLSVRSLASAYVLGFARVLGEFGATLMVAGNIPGRTRTIPTAIYAAVETNQWLLAGLWSAVLICIAFVLLLATRTKSQT
jgi:molybdate transport system permease protein